MASCLLRSVSVAALVAVALPAHAALTVKFINQNTDYALSNCYFIWYGGDVSASCSSGAVVSRQCYSFAYVSPGGVQLSNVVGGLVYVSVGKPMTSGRPPAEQPSFSNWTDPDYTTRWEKFEITYFPQDGDAADLTGVDSFSIPLSLKTYKTNVLRQTFGYNVDTADMISNLVACTVTNTALVEINSNFYRMLAPTQCDAYRPLDNYVTAAKNAHLTNWIVGMYDGRLGGPPLTTIPQRYRFRATFDSTGNLVMVGGSTNDAIGVGTSNSIVLSGTTLPTDIYRQNPLWTVNGIGWSFASNDVYCAGVRDILAGFAFGFVGSTVTDSLTGVRFMDEDSSFWFAQTNKLFGQLQTNVWYDQYAEVFWRHTDIYGMPFMDKYPQVLANLNTSAVDTLEVIILQDTIPEPGLLAPALLVWCVINRCKKHRAYCAPV